MMYSGIPQRKTSCVRLKRQEDDAGATDHKKHIKSCLHDTQRTFMCLPANIKTVLHMF